MFTAFITAFVVAVIVSAMINGLVFRLIAFGVTSFWNLARWAFTPIARFMARRGWFFVEIPFPQPVIFTCPRK